MLSHQPIRGHDAISLLPVISHMSITVQVIVQVPMSKLINQAYFFIFFLFILSCLTIFGFSDCDLEQLIELNFTFDPSLTIVDSSLWISTFN